MDLIAKARKAIAALIIALGGALSLAEGAQSPGGDAIIAPEWWTSAGLAAAAFLAVFLTPNKITDAQRAQIIAEYQAKRFGSGRHTAL